MANDASAKVAKAAAKGNGGGGSGTADARSRSGAGPTPYHRRSSYLPRDPKRAPKPPPPVAELARWRLRRVLCSWRFRWLVYDNSGSYNGWFDWLPLWMRVGPWNPFVGLTIAFLYAATFRFKPRPLEFAPFVLDGLEGDDGSDRIVGMPRATAVDLCIFVWCAVVMIQAKMSLGSIGFFPISFTGWSWLLLMARSGLEFGAWAAASVGFNRLAEATATLGSSIRLVVVTNACVVWTVWNFILLPIMYFKGFSNLDNEEEARRKFMRFNFGFFMTNIHLLNLPLAFVNILRGDRVRMFTMSDLWVSYLVVVLYSVLYFLCMDRLGMHFYPIFNPRTCFSVISILAVIGLYYFLFLEWNKYISLHSTL